VKKWLDFGGLAVMALAWGILFAACDPQEVDVVPTKAKKVASVTATKTGDYVIVTWKAVEDVGRYNLFVQEKDKVTIQEGSDFNLISTNVVKFSEGSLKENDDIDSWSGIGPITPFSSSKNYRFGVQTTPRDYTISSAPSDIVWSEYLGF
jgi:hypothetical protein